MMRIEEIYSWDKSVTAELVFGTTDVRHPLVSEIAPYVRYEEFDTGHGVNDRITLGLNVYLGSEYTKIQFNYHFNGESVDPLSNNELYIAFQFTVER